MSSEGVKTTPKPTMSNAQIQTPAKGGKNKKREGNSKDKKNATGKVLTERE